MLKIKYWQNKVPTQKNNHEDIYIRLYSEDLGCATKRETQEWVIECGPSNLKRGYL